MMSSKDIDAIIRDISLLIPVRTRSSNRFLEDNRRLMTDYAAYHEGCTREDILAEFGSCKDIALDYIESMDSDDLIRELSRVRLLRRLFTIIAVAVIIALSIHTAVIMRSYLEFRNAIVVQEQTVREELEGE